MKRFLIILFLIIILIPLILIIDFQINPWENGSAIFLIRDGIKKHGSKLIIYTDKKFITEDFSKLSPYKISSGVFRDKYKGIAIGVHTDSPFHPIPHEKIFIYVVYKDKLKPFFRSSKTSGVLEDFNLADFTKDGNTEIITIEKIHGEININLAMNIGFGFDVEKKIENIESAEFVGREAINIRTKDWEKIFKFKELNKMFKEGDEFK
ncbi:MAG: hypothetical protein Q4P29_03920 [Tissierellia bacterium]|nr:hypothetical protein [Tissierellia bacterium]